jgi:DNA excision repair protein ERCC-4
MAGTAIQFDDFGTAASADDGRASTASFNRLVVCPFAIVVDTREQAGYTFDGMPGRAGEQIVVPVVSQGLKSGDYSIQGLEDRVAVERKSLQDAYGTFGQGRERFERELERLAEYEFAAVVIEATVQELWRPAEFVPDWRSRLSPRSVEGSIVAWSLRYGVHFWAMGSRRAAEIRTFGVLRKFWEEQEKGKDSEKP